MYMYNYMYMYMYMWDMNIWEYNLERFELLRVQFCTTLVGYLVYIAFGTRFVFTRLAHFLF